MQYSIFLRLVFIIILISGQAQAANCGASVAFDQPDDSRTMSGVQHITGSTKIWRNTAAQKISAVLFRHSLQINTDGTSRSYSIEDFWGDTKALNNLCNAMTDNCYNLSQSQLHDRRVITQQAFADQWPSVELKATKIDPSIIPFRDGHPCPEINGYLVSATALQKPNNTNVCDQTNYLDALTVPAIVLPLGLFSKSSLGRTSTGFDTLNARLGDIVVAITPSSKSPVYGVVGDLGPPMKLGEASVAMNGALLGIGRQPINYLDVKRHWIVNDATILIFPGTRDDSDPYLTVDRIDQAAMSRFIIWGGGTLEDAMKRLQACSIAISK